MEDNSFQRVVEVYAKKLNEDLLENNSQIASLPSSSQYTDISHYDFIFFAQFWPLLKYFQILIFADFLEK